MKTPEAPRTWPSDLLQPVLDSLVQSHGAGFFIHGCKGEGKSTFLQDLRNVLWAAGSVGRVAGRVVAFVALVSRQLGDRRYLQCCISLEAWRDYPSMPLQGILAAELSLAIPDLGLPLSSAFFTRGEFTETLTSRGCEGLVILGDDLDRLMDPARRTCYQSDLAFLEELGGMISVYLLPVWLFFTLSGPLTVGATRQQAGGRLRHRYTSLYMQRARRLGSC